MTVNLLERLWEVCRRSDFVRRQLLFALEAVEGETASVMLLDEEGANLVFCVSVGENAFRYMGEGEYDAALRVPVSGTIGINPLVVLYGKPISMVEGDSRHNPEVDAIVGTKTSSLYSIPLAAGERVVGTFSAINAHGGKLSEKGSPGFGSEEMEAMNAASEAVRLWLTQEMEVLEGEPDDLRTS